MRKALGVITIITSVMAFVFMFNILLYGTVPFYKEALESAIADESIPVVEASNDPVIIPENDAATTASPTLEELKALTPFPEEASTSAITEEKAELNIIDKTYYEDCGSGKGYWVITYSDGSTVVDYR